MTRYNRGIELRKFEVGDIVKFYKPRIEAKNKLEKNYLGPARIVEKINDNAYKIEYEGRVETLNIDKILQYEVDVGDIQDELRIEGNEADCYAIVRIDQRIWK